MNKAGIYGALFFVCMILCHVLGDEFDFQYLYLAEIGLAAVSGLMLYLAIQEFYRDIHAQWQSRQEYAEGMKTAVEAFKDVCQNMMEGVREENKSAADRLRAEFQSAAETFAKECRAVIGDFGGEAGKFTEGLQAQNKKLIDDFCAENRTMIEGFGAENRTMIEGFGTENRTMVEGFGAKSKNMVEKFTAESRNAMEFFSEKNKHLAESMAAENRTMVEGLKKEVINAVEKMGTETKNAVESFGMETKNAIEDFGAETKNAMEGFGAETKNAMESFGAETKNAMENFGAETKNAVESFSAESRNVMESFGMETKNIVEGMRDFIVSTEEAFLQKQEKLEEEIRTICREQAEAAEASRKLLAETQHDMKQFAREESRHILAEFGEKNKLQIEQFSDKCHHYIEGLKKECTEALEKCGGLMEAFLPKQEALVKELRVMCEKQSENSNASRVLTEEMGAFLREQTGELRRENKDLLEEFSLSCLNVMDEFMEKTHSLFEDYNNCVKDSIDSHWRRISERTDESQSVLDKFVDESEAMMQQLTEAVKKVNEENSQYIAQMKEYQRELKQLSSEDIKMMEEILHGNR